MRNRYREKRKTGAQKEAEKKNKKIKKIYTYTKIYTKEKRNKEKRIKAHSVIC